MARVNFCNNIINLHNDILFMGEARFGRVGLFNVHNERYWSGENLHLDVERCFQNRFSVNVCAGIVEIYLIVPYF